MRSKKTISSNELALFLDISEKYLYKLFNSCSLMRMKYYSVEHLQFLVDNLSPSNIQEVVLIKQIQYFIEKKI